MRLNDAPFKRLVSSSSLFYPRKSKLKVWKRIPKIKLFTCVWVQEIFLFAQKVVAYRVAEGFWSHFTQFRCSAGLISDKALNAFPSIRAFNKFGQKTLESSSIINQMRKYAFINQFYFPSYSSRPNSLIQKILNSSFLCGEEIFPRQICCVTLFLFSHFFSFPRIKSESVWRHICCFHNPLWFLLQFVFIFLDD